MHSGYTCLPHLSQVMLLAADAILGMVGSHGSFCLYNGLCRSDPFIGSAQNLARFGLKSLCLMRPLKCMWVSPHSDLKGVPEMVRFGLEWALGLEFS